MGAGGLQDDLRQEPPLRRLRGGDRQVFESAGKVELVRVVTSMGRSKGFCYVDFRKTKSVKNALELCAAGKTVLKGRNLRVDFDSNKPRAGFHYRTDAYDSGYASGKKEKVSEAA